MCDWSELPKDLLNDIVVELENNIDDLARRGGGLPKTCRCITPNNCHCYCFPNDGNGKAHVALSLSDNKIFQVKMSRSAQRPWFRGSSSGWLVTLQRNPNPRVILRNPFTKAEIELPPPLPSQ
ncbi:hypothetical protein ACLOJK_001923 [Asimina triloba]